MDDWLKTLGLFILAPIGGILGYISRELNRGRTIQIFKVLFSGCCSGFVGVIVILICIELNLSIQQTGVVVAVSGWLGADVTIKMLEKLVHKMLGVRIDTSALNDDSNTNTFK